MLSPIGQKLREQKESVDLSFLKSVQPAGQSKPRITGLEGVGDTIKKTTEFLFPSARKLYEQRSQEAKQSLVLTPELKREIRAEQLAIAPDKDTDTPEEFFNRPAVGLPEFVGMAKIAGTAGKKILETIAKETNPTAVKKLIADALPDLSKSKDIDIISDVLSSEDDPQRVERIIDAALKRQADVTTKAAPRTYSADNLPKAGEDETVVQFVRGSDGEQWVSNDLSRAGEYPGQVEYGVVKNSKLRSTGNPEKDTAGYRLLDGDEADEVVKRNTTPGAKERGFITSAKEALPNAPKIAGQYVPRSTDELSIKAANFIKDDPVAAERMAREGSDQNAVAVASELLKKLAADADAATDEVAKAAFYDKAADIANTIAPKLTELGRAVQAASILGRLTPEGQVRFAAREIQRFNEANPARRIPELTGEQTKKITEEMKVIQQMPDGFARAMRFKELQNYVQDLVPTPLWKKVTTVWKAGLLTGLKTTGLNLFSNLSHSLTEIAKDVPAAIVDSAAALFTGERTKTVTLRNVFDGVKEGVVKGKRYFSTGFDEREIGEKLDYHRVNFGKGPAAKAFRAYTDLVFRTMGATDQPFYYAALSRSLMDQALAQGKNLGLKGDELVEHAYKVVEDPTEEMLRYGVADATTAVFQNQTNLGLAASKIQQIPGIGQIVLPFGRTPSAVAMQIISYSPVGVVKTLIENIGKGKFDQRQFSQGLGRAITGTAVMYLGMELAKKGLISLDYPVGDEREQELQKAEGVKNNAINVDGKWRSPIVLGPAGNLLLIGGHLQTAIEKAGSPTEAMSKALFGSMKSFSEQTFLTGISNAVNALLDPEQYAASYLPSLMASFVPTIVSDVARATDPSERRAETAVEKVQARVPGLRDNLEPQVDILGRERDSVGNPLEIMLDPTRPSPETGTPVTDELRRLTEEGHAVSPTKVGDKKGFSVLSQAQNTELWKHSGEITNAKLTALFADERYQAMADDEKAKTVETFVEKSKNSARAAMVLELTQDLEGDALKAKLSELKEGKLLTRDVFRLYGEMR